MFILFAIGLLLIITSFSAYSKLGQCNNPELQTKLRWAIGVGTTFLTLSIGYSVCITRDSCDCDFGERASWKIYFMLLSLMGMGIALLILALGIKSDLKKCNVDLGSAPNILTGLAITQIVLPAIYIIGVVYTGKSALGSSSRYSGSHSSAVSKSQAKKSAIRSTRNKRAAIKISQIEASLEDVRNRIEITEARGREPKDRDLEDQDRLVIDLAAAQAAKKSIGLSTSSGHVGTSSVSSSSNDAKPKPVVTQWRGWGAQPTAEDDDDTD
tara:strand:+ start:64 stop:870 length:807 start_codon:yes stop_codon:yes gene_type:complete